MSNTPATPGTSDGADPSMEDILASIRRILNEEDAQQEGEQPADGTPGDDLLVLDSSMMVSNNSPAPEPDPEPAPPIHVPPPSAPPPETEAVTTSPAPAADSAPHPALLAPEVAAAAASSVGNLVRTLSAGKVTQVYSGGPTLEDMVRAELRPLLKEWLDTNLSSMVERLVRAEIEKVIGRAAI